MNTYAVSSEIREFHVEISAADIIIKQGDAFAVESNLKPRTVDDKNGVLTIKDTDKWFQTDNDSTLVITIPEDVMFEKAEIETGAGEITISEGTFNNLDFDMGVGELNLTAALTGECEFDLGVGESNITLLGSEDDYSLDVEKGLGDITVDGDSISNTSGLGSGQNKVEISGGVGAINVTFKKK